jgi:hypothetical protein
MKLEEVGNLRTCSSLGEITLETKRKLFKQNFTLLAEQRIDQLRDEHLLKIDHCLENMLIRLPRHVLDMNVREFTRKDKIFNSNVSEFAFEPLRKRPRREERTSQEAFKRRVRQALAEADKDQEIFLPGSGRFVHLPTEQQQSILNLLNAVVSTYSELIDPTND